MAITKHKLFKIPIKNGDISLNAKVLKEVNNFLVNENIVYINHSITVISSNDLAKIANIETSPRYTPELFQYQVKNTFCIISLIYKDLAQTSNDISNLSFKTKEVVRNSIETKEKLPKPNLKF